MSIIRNDKVYRYLKANLSNVWFRYDIDDNGAYQFLFQTGTSGADIAAVIAQPEFQNQLNYPGATTATGDVLDGLPPNPASAGFADGSQASPSIFFTNETGLGFYRRGSGQLGVAASGVGVGWFSSTGYTANSTLVQATFNGIATTSTDSFVMANGANAALGAQQISPRLRYFGSGWATGTSASMFVETISEMLPVQGAAAPTGILRHAWQINSAGYVYSYSEELDSATGGVKFTALGGATQGFTFTPAGAGIVVLGTATYSTNNNTTGTIKAQVISAGAFFDVLDSTALAANNGGGISFSANTRSAGNSYGINQMAYIKGGKQNAADNDQGGYLDIYTRGTLGSGLALGARLIGGFGGNPSLLLGGLGVLGIGVLQFPAATTNAGGITFSDAYIFRAAAGKLNIQPGGTTVASVEIRSGAWGAGNIAQVTLGDSGVKYISGIFGGGLRINSQGTGADPISFSFGGSYGTGETEIAQFEITSGNLRMNGTRAFKLGATAGITIVASADTSAGNLVITNSATGYTSITSAAGGSGTDAPFIVNTTAATNPNVGIFTAASLSTSNTAYFNFGRNSANNNWVSLGFNYVGNGSTSNVFNVSFFGGSALTKVTAGGNYGVNTTALPLARLHVVESGTDYTTASSDTAGCALFIGPSAIAPTTNIAIFSNSAQSAGAGGTIGLGGLFNATNTAMFASIRGSKENSASGDYAGNMILATRINGGAMTAALTLSSAQIATFAGDIVMTTAKTLKLGNAKVVGAAVQGGTVTVLDSTGATIQLLCV